jgi:hypothetical protein
MAGLRGETLREWAREAQDLDIAAERAAGLATAVEQLNAPARAAEKALPFDSEPALFVLAQRRWSRAGR